MGGEQGDSGESESVVGPSRRQETWQGEIGRPVIFIPLPPVIYVVPVRVH